MAVVKIPYKYITSPKHPIASTISKIMGVGYSFAFLLAIALWSQRLEYWWVILLIAIALLVSSIVFNAYIKSKIRQEQMEEYKANCQKLINELNSKLKNGEISVNQYNESIKVITESFNNK